MLWHCFQLRSASIYPNDLGGNKSLEDYTGHIEHGPDMQKTLQTNGIPLVKTHEVTKDNNASIYIIRDGRAACVSLWKFYNKSLPLIDVIEGRHMFGTWSHHVLSWEPWNRPNTLLLKYEELRDDLPGALKSISQFLDKPIIKTDIPSRDSIAGIDGRWVRRKTSWKSMLAGSDLKRFMELNKTTLKKQDTFESLSMCSGTIISVDKVIAFKFFDQLRNIVFIIFPACYRSVVQRLVYLILACCFDISSIIVKFRTVFLPV